MIKLKLKAELYQTDGGNVTLVQIENELGEITNNLATRVSAGEYILNIPDGFKNEVHVFCPQHRSAFNVVGSENNTFILLGTEIDDSNYMIQTVDQDLNPWEDSLSKIPFELTVYKNDFLPV